MEVNKMGIQAIKEPGFFEVIDLFGRTTRATNFVLDHWYFFAFLLLLYWAFRKLRDEHALLGNLDERCEAAFGDIDALLAERHALIPNLVETVKGFGLHEHKVLTEVVDARARAVANVGALRLEAENQIGQSINSLFAITENYPEIAASSHFRELRSEMTRIEDRITASRRFYNLAVEELNSIRRAFPGNLVAMVSTIGSHDKFSLSEKRAQFSEPVQVSFSAS
jgi:LemA protein